MTPRPCAASEHSEIDESCGYPTPATLLVVQTEPGPIPSTISAPARIKASVISLVATLPAIIILSLKVSYIF